MNRILSALRAAWRREPVLISTGLPLLVTVGVITTDQATAVTNAIGATIAIAAQLAAAFGARRVVTSPATQAKKAAR